MPRVIQKDKWQAASQPHFWAFFYEPHTYSLTLLNGSPHEMFFFFMIYDAGVRNGLGTPL